MQLKTFKATSMHEALELVRREMGPGAAVLGTREVPQRRLFGLLSGEPRIEVTASTEVNVPSQFDAERSVVRTQAADAAARADIERQLAELRKTVEQLEHDHSPGKQEPEEKSASECRSAPHEKQAEDLSSGLAALVDHLVRADVEPAIARQLVEQLRGRITANELDRPETLHRKIAELIAEKLNVAGPIQTAPNARRLVALVGPTGVGKTTTIAKLAADFHLRQRRRVGLITVDTYRIAAVEQLRTYAEIIDLPMRVVTSAGEMRDAVDRMRRLDLVLIDTAGRSPRDDVKIRELQALLDEAQPDEVHLVLSATAGARALGQAVERFAPAEPSRLIVTKLDEACGLGGMLAMLRRSGLPVSYLTDGQNVPDDIAPAHAERMAEMIVGG